VKSKIISLDTVDSQHFRVKVSEKIGT